MHGTIRHKIKTIEKEIEKEMQLKLTIQTTGYAPITPTILTVVVYYCL